MRKTKIVRCALFLLIFVFVFIGVSYALRPLGAEEISFKSFYAEDKKTLDVVYIGGSVCVVDWMPYTAWSEQGITSYALGKSTLYSFNVLPLVKEALTRQSPELLIIDLRPFEYTGTEREVYKYNFLRLASAMPATSPNRLKILQNGLKYSVDLDETDTALSFYIDLIRYHSLWEDVNLLSLEYALPGLYSNNTKGFVFISKYMRIELNDNSDDKEETPCPAVTEEDLNELMAFLKGKGLDALFVVAPYKESAEQREQYNYLAKKITDNGFQYLNSNDYYREMGIDGTREFYNEDHPNIFGAEKYTAFLSQYIDQLYDLPDRRGDEKYAKWEEGYGNWIDQSDKVKEEVEELIQEYNAAIAQMD